MNNPCDKNATNGQVQLAYDTNVLRLGNRNFFWFLDPTKFSPPGHIAEEDSLSLEECFPVAVKIEATELSSDNTSQAIVLRVETRVFDQVHASEYEIVGREKLSGEGVPCKWVYEYAIVGDSSVGLVFGSLFDLGEQLKGLHSFQEALYAYDWKKGLRGDFDCHTWTPFSDRTIVNVSMQVPSLAGPSPKDGISLILTLCEKEDGKFQISVYQTDGEDKLLYAQSIPEGIRPDRAVGVAVELVNTIVEKGFEPFVIKDVGELVQASIAQLGSK